MDAVAGAAVGPALHRLDELAVAAGEKALRLISVARPAQRGQLVRCGDAVDFRGAGGFAVAHALPVAGRAVEAGFEVLVSTKILGDCGVAYAADLV